MLSTANAFHRQEQAGGIQLLKEAASYNVQTAKAAFGKDVALIKQLKPNRTLRIPPTVTACWPTALTTTQALEE